MTTDQRTALIVGAGSGLSAALARVFAGEGMRIALAARSAGKLAPLVKEIGAKAYACDAANVDDVTRLFAAVAAEIGEPEVVVYNASFRTRGAFVDLKPDEVKKALEVSAYGGFLVGQAAARRMVARGQGAIFFTGASASVKGYAQSAPFAMGKFALRGLAQSMARELSPLGMAGLLTYLADGTRTQPVKRGAYVLDVLWNRPPPLPVGRSPFSR